MTTIYHTAEITTEVEVEMDLSEVLEQVRTDQIYEYLDGAGELQALIDHHNYVVEFDEQYIKRSDIQSLIEERDEFERKLREAEQKIKDLKSAWSLVSAILAE